MKENDTLLNQIHKSNCSQDHSAICQSILYSAYKHIGEVDALYGCGTNLLMETSSRIEHVMLGRKYEKALGMLGSDQVSTSTADVLYQAGLLKTLKQFGNSSQESSENRSYHLECSWRLSQWDENLVEDAMLEKKQEFSAGRTLAVRALLQDDKAACMKQIQRAYQAVTDNLGHEAFESTRAIYETLGKLRSLRELEILSENLCLENDNEKALETLRNLQEFDPMSFTFSEGTLLQRCVVVENLSKKLHSFQTLSIDLSLDYINRCKAQSRHQLAWNRLELLEQTVIGGTNCPVKLQLQFERAKLLWESEEKDLAKLMLTQLNDKIERKEVQAHRFVNLSCQ